MSRFPEERLNQTTAHTFPTLNNSKTFFSLLFSKKKILDIKYVVNIVLLILPADLFYLIIFKCTLVLPFLFNWLQLYIS